MYLGVQLEWIMEKVWNWTEKISHLVKLVNCTKLDGLASTSKLPQVKKVIT